MEYATLEWLVTTAAQLVTGKTAETHCFVTLRKASRATVTLNQLATTQRLALSRSLIAFVPTRTAAAAATRTMPAARALTANLSFYNGYTKE
jgi:hypothetical protein